MAFGFHSEHARRHRHLPGALAAAALALVLGSSGALTGCGGPAAAAERDTSGPAFELPAEVVLAPFDAAAAVSGHGAAIDTSHVADGYVAASCVCGARLKLQVSCGEQSYNYDLPNDGTPISCPLNLGDGAYRFRVMQNTTDESYVELLAATADVVLRSEFEPYLRPNVFCSYGAESAVVAKARELAAGCENEGDVMHAVYNYVVGTIRYDTAAADALADVTGYVPSPDATLASEQGICFDYSALAAAMLRSLGIPCQIVTGWVDPDNLYHAWNRVYLDGTWVGVGIDIQARTWTPVDLTFAAAGDTPDPSTYRPRYTY